MDERKYACKIIGITLAVYIAFRYLLPLVVPFVLAFLVAKLLEPVIKIVQKKFHISRKIASPILLVVSLALIGTFLFFVVLAAGKQLAALIKNLPCYQNLWMDNVGQLCCGCDRMFGLCDGTFLGVVKENGGKMWGFVQKNVYPSVASMAAKSLLRVGRFGVEFFIFFVATLMLMNSAESREKSRRQFVFYDKWAPMANQIRTTGVAFLRAQAIIIFIVAGICALGLWLIGNPYAIVFGIGIGIFDAFPIVGSGSILVPWTIFYVFVGNYKNAAILITIYLATFILRELLEPRLLGNRLGISSFVMMMSLVVGIKLFGVAGIALGPIGAVIIVWYAKKENPTGN